MINSSVFSALILLSEHDKQHTILLIPKTIWTQDEHRFSLFQVESHLITHPRMFIQFKDH